MSCQLRRGECARAGAAGWLCLLLALLLAAVATTTHGAAVAASAAAGAAAAAAADKPLMSIGLVADNHYDTFPAGEKAPWQPMPAWLQEQARRTTGPLKRRYDIARDKMYEAVDVFNRASASPLSVPMTFAVNLGDLVNNDLMWNLRPILDAFNAIDAPKYSIVGNHDRRAHNDRFGKNNATQEKWLMDKLGLREWFYAVDYPPFMNIFLDSMVMEEPESNPKRREQLVWLKATLARARDLRRVVILFGHISIGLATSPFAPLLKEYPHIVGGFFGHHHKGGYMLQGTFHTTIIQGQIETLTNAFAVLDVFRDRMELTGFGRVPTRVMRFENPDTVALLRAYTGPVGADLRVNTAHQPAPPEQLWGSQKKTSGGGGGGGGGEALQPVPPLHLNLPAYRKPNIAPADPNGGDTRFLKVVYATWPRRVKTLAPEPPVDLTSFHKSQRTWYGIAKGEHRHGAGAGAGAGSGSGGGGGRDDGSDAAAVPRDDPDSPPPPPDPVANKKRNQPASGSGAGGGDGSVRKTAARRAVGAGAGAASAAGQTAATPNADAAPTDDGLFLVVEVTLVLCCIAVVLGLVNRHRRLFGLS